MVIYAIGQGFLCILIIIFSGIVIIGIKDNLSNAESEIKKKVAKWVPILLHALQATVAGFWIIDALFPLLDNAITAIEQGIITFISRHLLLLVVTGLIV